MATGRHPFEEQLTIPELVASITSPSPTPLPSGLDPTLRSVVSACLDKNPPLRPSAVDLTCALDALLGHPTFVTDEASPFPGLHSLDESSSGSFFGRDREIEHLLERLRHEPVISLVGPSGAGKSSLVRAGVVSRLVEKGTWKVIVIRPGSDPFGSLDSATRSQNSTCALEPDTSTSAPSNAVGLFEEPRCLALRLEAISMSSGSMVLLVVDQLEELLTQGSDPEQARRFLISVCTASEEKESPVRVLLILRDDFLGRAALDDEVAKVLGRVVVLGPPGPGALREILLRPVELRGYHFESGDLPDRMVEATHGLVACLPLLQVAARQLWERRDRDRKLILSSAFERIGGIEGAIATHADDVLATLPAEQALKAPRLLVRLVSDQRTRRIVPWAEVEALGQDAIQVAEQLVDARLLTRRTGSGGLSVVELSHEALISHWRRLGEWLDAGREELKFVTEIETAAGLWDRRGRPDSEVWLGQALREATDKARRLQVSLPGAASLFLDRAREVDRRMERRKKVGRLIALATLSAVTLASVLVALGFQRKSTVQELALLLTEARETRSQGRPSHALALLRAACDLQGTSLGGGARFAVELDPGEPLQQLAADGFLHREMSTGTRITDMVAPRAGHTALARTKDGELLGLDLDMGRQEWSTRACPSKLGSLALSPDERLVALGCADGTWQLRDARTGALMQSTRCGDQEGGELAWSGPDTILFGNSDGNLCAWETTRGEQLWNRRLPHGAQLVRPGLHRVAVAGFGTWEGDDHALSVLRVSTGETLFEHSQVMRTVRGLALSPDEELLAARIQVSGTGESEMKVWSLETLKLLVDIPRTRWPSEVAWSPDGGRLVIGDEAGTVIDARSAKVLFQTGIAESVVNPVFSKDGRVLALGDWGGTVTFVDGETGRLLHQEHVHDGTVHRPILLDDRRALSYGSEGRVEIWELEGALLGVLPTLASPSGSPISAPGKDLAFIPTSSGALELWNLSARERLGIVPPVGSDPAPAMIAAPSPSGNLLAVTHLGGRITLHHRTQEGYQPLWSRAWPEGDISGPVWAHDESYLAIAHAQCRTRVLATSDGQVIAEPLTERGPACPAWLLDEGATMVLRWGSEGLMATCRTADWSCDPPLELPKMSGHLSLLPDGRTLAGGLGQDIAVMDLFTGERRRWADAPGKTRDILGTHDGRIMTFTTTEDGRHGLSGSVDQTGKLWDLEKGTELASFRTDRGWIQPARLLEGTRFALYGTSEDVLELRELPSGRLTQVFEGWDSIFPAFLLLENPSRVVLAHRQHGTAIFQVVTDSLTEAWRSAGERTNLRTCRGSHEVVGVTPWPSSKEVWAPTSSCPR